MKQSETYELIEQYLLGKLSGQDLRAFEQRLASEPDFAKEVALQREVFDAIRLEGKAAAFRQQLEDIEKKTATEEPVRRMVPIRRWLALAAGLTLLAVAGWWFFLRNDQQPTTSQELFAAYFQPPSEMAIPAAQRNGDTADVKQLSPEDGQWNSLWEELETQYEGKNFGAALATLQQIQALDPAGAYASETYYYAGLLHLQTQQPALALEDFQKVAVGHSEDKAWYSALALLTLDRRAEAMTMLEEMTKTQHPKRAIAEELLHRLGSFQ